MTSDQLHKLLVDTRNYIATHGWTRGQSRDKLGRVCLYGGVSAVRDRQPAFQRDEIAHALGFSGTYTAVRWNDRHAKSIEEVLERLDKAIAKTAPEPEDVTINLTIEENKNVEVVSA